MSSYSQASRGRPALYKPTDFGRDQTRVQVNVPKEVKTDEKVVKKIQKRPSVPSEEKPTSKVEGATPVTAILKPITSSASASDSKKPVDETPTGVSQRDLDKIQKLQEFMAKQQLEANSKGEQNDKKDNKDKGKRETPKFSKPKDKDSKNGKFVQSRNQRSQSNTANYSNNNEKTNKNKSQLEKQKDKPGGKGKEPVKTDKKDPLVSSGRGKNNSNNGPGYKNQGQGRGSSASYYAHSGFQPGVQGMPDNLALMQMQYAMGVGRENQSILGNPYNQRLDMYKMTQGNQKQDQQKGASKPAQSKPVADAAKPVLTKPNTAKVLPMKPVGIPDKSERLKSLAFVKNFFDTDPEVVYNRKNPIEKKTELATAAASNNTKGHISKPSASVTDPMSSNMSAMSSMMRTNMTNQMMQQATNAAQAQAQALLQNQNQHFHSASSSYASAYHQTDPINNSLHMGNHSSLQNVGQASMHPTNHSSLHSNSQSSYIQQNAAALQQQQRAQLAGAHQNTATASQYHASLGHHSLQQQQQQQHQSQQQNASGNYHEMFSSQMNPSALMSPGSNPYGMLQQQQQQQQGSNMNNNQMGGYSMYSTYFPQGTPHSHVHHVDQQLDPNVMAKILNDQKKTKKWQETAMNKCGPIDSSQARSLIEQLIDGTYECMVCCDHVKLNNAVWSCTNCHHMFHLNCIRKWAKSEAAAVKGESGWRCPGCQNVSTRPPNKYYCFCGKVRDPDWNPRDGITPHSCGEVCKKKRVTPPCQHGCNELCHPGPCPPCPVMVSKHCPCGKSKTKTRCGQVKAILCESVCTKLLKCGQHYCQKKCHQGPCDVCVAKFNQECFCGKQQQILQCGTAEVTPVTEPLEEEFTKTFSCNKPCQSVLNCGSHSCKDMCHPYNCKECPLLPQNVVYCPCGKIKVEELFADGESRDSCTDPIPTCDSFCGKKLQCGPKGSSHLCMMKCHNGECKPCNKVTLVQCRCGATKKDIACKDMTPGEPVLCDRKCNKKRRCGRHKCNQKCCVDKDHNCNIICSKKLSCGQHKCDEVCHTGFCPSCWRAGFDELACRCGSTVLYPPISCGAKPPECDQPCDLVHPCSHQVLHSCHNDETCPPCTVLTTKQCMGGHEIWKNVACHLTDVSCGRKCGKVLKCGLHACIKTCHKGVCLEDSENCSQQCPVKRSECGHSCGSPCHPGVACPSTSCKSQVVISCRCGRKTANALCLSGNVNSAYQSFNAEMLSNQLHNLQSGQSIDISKLTNGEKRPKFLECDEECARLERNKRLAEALGIENPDDGAVFQHTHFSPSLKLEAKAHLPFVQTLEGILENLIALAKKSSQGQVQHSFPPMNVNQRKVVHELAEVYNCKTYSLDQEPKRNTVVVATKNSYAPSVKLSTLTERDIMQPMPPQPIMLTHDDNAMLLGGAIPRKQILKPSYPSQPAPTKINYFDDELLE